MCCMHDMLRPYRASVARERHNYNSGPSVTSIWPLAYVGDSNNLTLEREEEVCGITIYTVLSEAKCASVGVEVISHYLLRAQ